jgi:phage baseplate assembly protein V
MIRAVQKLMAPMSRRVRLMVGRAVILLVNDGLKEQGLQISLLDGEVRDQVERYQHYGFTSHPHPGGEAITVAIGGSRDHLVVVADGDRRYRFRFMQTGEVALYTDEEDHIHLKRNREIEVIGGEKVTVQTKVATVTATTSATVISPEINLGDGARGALRRLIDERFMALFNGHTHPGIQPGSGSTGAPNQTLVLASHATDITRAI